MSGQLHPASYYAATANPAPDRQALNAAIDVDVCVIGAGLTGCSTALNLVEKGYSVAVLEANRVGWGASGRSGGQMIFGYACDMQKLENLVGPQDARLLWDVSVEALNYSRSLIDRFDIQCDLKSGHLHAAVKPRHQRTLESWQQELEKDYGYTGLQLLDREALGTLLQTDAYAGGLLDPNSAHLHPLNYTLGLAAAAESAGAVIYENSAAERIEYDARPTVTTASGRVRCKYLVFCGNAYLGGVENSLRKKTMPVGTYIIATEPLGEQRARALIANDMAVADMNFVLDYFRLSADHRLLFGGRVSYSTVAPLNLSRAMRPRMLKIFPQLGEVKIDYSWGGFVSITANRAPHFGRLRDNVYFAQGFSGHGIALTGMAGKLMADAIAGTAEKFDVFTRIPHLSFPGGPLFRTPALMLAMTWYRLRDLL
ncbi:MAG: FAD-binding oxidoreductase [Thiogranum sp.]|nr:FAD-binding oxidoreductase [Thiogranum sp.]